MICPGQHDDCHICVRCGACRPGLTIWEQDVLEFNHTGKGYVPILSDAMDIHWMTRSELTQAIPPAYTRYIGECFMRFAEGSM